MAVERVKKGKALIIKDVGALIMTIRNQKVIVDRDLAEIYGVQTRRLNEQVKRNPERFPEDFMFRLTKDEAGHWLRSRSQIAILKRGENIKYLPYAFTEHGAIMAANVLNSPQAVRMSVFVVRAFIKLREMLATHKELAHKLAELERKLQDHDESIRSLVVAIRQLMAPPEPEPPKKRIGFLVEEPKIPYITKMKGRS
jgi:phage regulator Rha-like protein